jgi:hypothetical protein
MATKLTAKPKDGDEDSVAQDSIPVMPDSSLPEASASTFSYSSMPPTVVPPVASTNWRLVPANNWCSIPMMRMWMRSRWWTRHRRFLVLVDPGHIHRHRLSTRHWTSHLPADVWMIYTTPWTLRRRRRSVNVGHSLTTTWLCHQRPSQSRRQALPTPIS